jgi:hypothetical protein
MTKATPIIASVNSGWPRKNRTHGSPPELGLEDQDPPDDEPPPDHELELCELEERELLELEEPE